MGASPSFFYSLLLNRRAALLDAAILTHSQASQTRIMFSEELEMKSRRDFAFMGLAALFSVTIFKPLIWLWIGRRGSNPRPFAWEATTLGLLEGAAAMN
jgi:hypothetical protein